MKSVNVWNTENRTAPGHYDVFARTVFEDERVSIRHNLILATGGADPHVHPFDAHHIFFVIRGSLRVRCGGREVIMKTGSAFWFEPGEEHQVLADGEADAEYITINVPSFNSFKKEEGK